MEAEQVNPTTKASTSCAEIGSITR